jgi:hypothetical protein
MRKPRIVLFCRVLLFSAFVSGSLNAQTAAELDTILDTSAVTNAQAARFVLAAAEVLPVDVSPEDAFRYAKENKWLNRKAEAGGTISLGGLSHLIMKAFGLRGGFLYAFFPGPRYGYRALIRRGLIQGFADPALRVSGERFLLILGRASEYAGRGLAGGNT